MPLNWHDFTDASQLEAAAISRCQELNAELDAQRIGQALAAVRPAPAPAQTIGELIKLYKLSPKWTNLAPKSQRGYKQCLRKIEDWAADAPVRAITAQRVQKLKEAMNATPAFGNAVIRVLRLLLEFGVRQDWIRFNPAKSPDLHGSTPAGIIWPREAVKAFVETADDMGWHSIGTAVLINEWLGQREGDILRLVRTAYRDGKILIRQGKGRKRDAAVILSADMVPAVAQRLAAELARLDALPSTPMHIIVNENTHRPYSQDTFRHLFAEIRAKAAKMHPDFDIDVLLPGRDSADPDAFKVRMLDLTYMRLRHTAVTRLAEAGCTAEEIAGITGHSLTTVTQILSRYLVRTASLARTAFQKRLDAESEG